MKDLTHKENGDEKEDKKYLLILTLIYLQLFFSVFSVIVSTCNAQTDFSTEYAYVPNEKTNEIYVINTTTNNVIAILPVGKIPNGVAVNHDGSKVYVTNTGNDEFPGRRYSIISTDTFETTPKLVGEGGGYKPLGIAISPDETLYIASSVTDKVYAINQTNLKTTPISVGVKPLGVAITPDSKWVYVANQGSNSVSVINTITNNVTTTIPVGSEPYEVTVDPTGETVYVTNQNSSSVSVINTTTNNVTATVNVNVYPHGVAVTPDSKKVYVAHHNSYKGIVSVIDTNTYKVTPIDIQAVNLCGVAVTNNGNFVYVTATGSKDTFGGIFVINTTTDIPKKVLGKNGFTGLGQFIGPVDGYKLETMTTLLSSNRSITSQTLTTTPIATVRVPPQEIEKLSGTVIFMDEASPIGNGSDINSAGQAFLDTSLLPNGSHSITARYKGNDKFRPSASSSLPLTVDENPNNKTFLEIIHDNIVSIFIALCGIITALIGLYSAYIKERK